MAKKKSKSRRVPSSTPRMYSDGRPSVVAQGSDAVNAAASGAASGAAVRSPQLSQVGRSQVGMAAEYRYVLNDLRRLGIIAAATFVVLVLLGLVIR